ncbi:PAS domain-containing sensor histidine kinase [Colwellia sp. RSH04]|uniref:sensor histidine kinase n=1 Tax=Colwellia sp. RSH04 TaxID=2305464 RepID=UPI000E5823D8|nr:ATP-binding protein [Colwellia sp. RSH04]RHW74750.1 histidine kinase [Colwellia sp. RSH04]
MQIVKLLLLNVLFLVSYMLLLPLHIGLFACNSILIIVLAVMYLKREKQQKTRTFQALLDGLRNLQDGDFSFSLTENHQQYNDEQQHQLITLFNQVTEKLREEKQSLYQRELLLDKVVNASDVVTVLVNHRGTIIFANLAAQQFLESSMLLGKLWIQVLEQQMPDLLQHNDKHNGIIQLLIKEELDGVNRSADAVNDKTEQSWHLSRHQLKLHASSHELILLKPITKELHQQELQTWKKIIKVINHELNNSIAPISSMCHSGLVLADRLNEPQLNRVFNTISGRIKKLSEFIQSYSQLARLSIPQKTNFNIVKTIEQFKEAYQLEIISSKPSIEINADEGQVEQLLINVFKNAKELSPNKPIQVNLSIDESALHINIRDQGPGMALDVMKKAFLPYYSTKKEGSGIGLSICREVIDAHHGKIALNNHPEGGLQVMLSLPLAKE